MTQPPQKASLLSLHGQILPQLGSLRGKQRSLFIQGLNRDQINCISEVFSNFLRKNLTTDPQVIKRLKRYRQPIRSVALKKTSLKQKKKVLSSRVGGSILAVLAPLAISLISKVLGS